MQFPRLSLFIFTIACYLLSACDQSPITWQAAKSEQISLSGDIWAGKPIGKKLSVPDLGPESKRQWESFVQDSMSLMGDEDLIPLSLALFLEERQSRYIEVLERSLWNDGLVNAYRNNDSTYHPADLTYVSGPDSLFINLYVAGLAELSVNGQALTINVRTRYPWEESISLEIQSESELTFTIGLRIPGFSRNQAVPGNPYRYLYTSNRKLELRINEDLTMPDAQEGYAFVTRSWRDGDKLDLVLPMAVRRVQKEKIPALIALEKGPILYGIPQENVPLDLRLSKSRQYFLVDSLEGRTRTNWLRGPIWQDDQMIETLAAPLYHLESRKIKALNYALPYR
ncbi:MAG: hypothetical protein AB8H47_10105 [Bacteroidia bacterium]